MLVENTTDVKNNTNYSTDSKISFPKSTFSTTKDKVKKDAFIPSPSPSPAKKRKYKRQPKAKFDDIEYSDDVENSNGAKKLAKDYYIDNVGNKIDYTAPQGMHFIPF